MKRGVAVYRTNSGKYHSSTCEQLKAAVAKGEAHLYALARGAYPGIPMSPNLLSEVRNVGYWNTDYDQSWGLDWHRNEGVEIIYVARGRVGFSVDSQSFCLRPGDLTITRPWQLHRVGDPNVSACRLYWLILDIGVRHPNQVWKWPSWIASSEKDIKDLTNFLGHNEQPVWRSNDEVASCFEKLGELAQMHSEQTALESRIRLCISGLLVSLTELLRYQEPSLDKSFPSTSRTVELFLNSLPNSLDNPWSVDSMAKACNLGRSRFTHYCQELTNMSSNDYLNECRIRVASDLLSTNDKMSITDIAMECGFGSSQYLSTVFRNRIGHTPKEYRKSATLDLVTT